MKVSIALCTYNGEAFLAEQLASLSAQTRLADEIVCCDDSSTDNTWLMLEAFAAANPGVVRLTRNSTNLGPKKNFENAVAHCSGDFIFLCDQDDEWLPDKVEKMVGYLAKHPEANGVFCNGWLIDEQGNKLGETMWDALYFELSLRRTTTPENILYYLLLNGNIATGTALCFRKSVLAKVLPLDVEDGTWHDHWLALVMSAEGGLHFFDEPLLRYRIHGLQQVGFPGRGQSAPDFRNAVIETWIGPLTSDDKGIKTTHLAWALQAYERLEPKIVSRLEDVHHLKATGSIIACNLQTAKTAWLRKLPLVPRKMKLIKHWLKGGEYLRITFGDCVTI